MYVTLQMNIPVKPTVTVHGDMVRCDIYNLIIEFDRRGFNDFVDEVISQSISQGLNLNLKR